MPACRTVAVTEPPVELLVSRQAAIAKAQSAPPHSDLVFDPIPGSTRAPRPASRREGSRLATGPRLLGPPRVEKLVPTQVSK
jgi:hypothetical protein